MSNRKFSVEFNTETVKQVVERGYPVREVSERLGVSIKSLYAWLRRPISNRGKEDKRLLELVRESYVASDKSYGSPRVHLDLRDIWGALWG